MPNTRVLLFPLCSTVDPQAIGDEKEEIMSRKTKIQGLLDEAAMEIFGHIKDSELSYPERWVPAASIKDALGLKLPSYPRKNKINNETGWLFATLARILEDKGLVEFRKENKRSFYRTK